MCSGRVQASAQQYPGLQSCHSEPPEPSGAKVRASEVEPFCGRLSPQAKSRAKRGNLITPHTSMRFVGNSCVARTGNQVRELLCGALGFGGRGFSRAVPPSPPDLSSRATRDQAQRGSASRGIWCLTSRVAFAPDCWNPVKRGSGQSTRGLALDQFSDIVSMTKRGPVEIESELTAKTCEKMGTVGHPTAHLRVPACCATR
jgi:hypothetical protein